MSGFVCCGQYKYYAFPHVEEKVAPSVDFNLTTGRIKALYWRHDACPRESEHVDNGRCRGWCVHARLVPAEHACPCLVLCPYAHPTPAQSWRQR